MKYNAILFGIFFLAMHTTGWSQKFLQIDDFNEPRGAWFEAGNVALNPTDEKKLIAKNGSGLFISEHGKTVNLVTKQTHGDIQLELDFMLSKGSNSGVYLQGRYEVQIFDSYGRQKPGSGDCGGIYARYNGKNTYEGTPPIVNGAKKHGEWQHLFIKFKAPRFNSKGEKIKNAVFKKVKLNGILVQKNTEVTGPTASSLDNIEEAKGPLMCQGDHGPIAYRAIKLKNR